MVHHDDRTEILNAIERLRDDMREDNASLWRAIDTLNDQVSVGKGAVRALLWVGGVLITVGTIVVNIWHYLIPPTLRP